MLGLWNFLKGPLDSSSEFYGLITTLIVMGITGALLVKDLDRPDRFLYVLLRPQWQSWLVKGAYIITIFAGLVTINLIDYSYGFNWTCCWVLGSIYSVLCAIYTAFTFSIARASNF